MDSTLTTQLITQFVKPETVERFGVSFFFAIIFLLLFLVVISMLIKAQNKSLKSLTNAVVTLAGKIGLPYLCKETTFTIVRIVFKKHIYEKLTICREYLTKNSIKENKSTIQKELRAKFQDITQKECSELNRFNTEVGAIGDLCMMAINWEKLFKHFDDIFFSDWDNETKIRKIEALMEHYVNKIINSLEGNYAMKNRSFVEV